MDDAARLRTAAKHHPLVHWAMRYALAVVHIDQGRRAEARELVATAPAWPEGSAFNAFQTEILEQASSKHGSRHTPGSRLQASGAPPSR